MTEKLWNPKVKEIGDAVANLTLAEAADLRDYLKMAYGIEAPNPYAGMPVLGPPPREMFETCGHAEWLKHNLNNWKVVYDGLVEPARKIAVIKVLREITGCGLAEGKAISESSQHTVRDGLYRDEADGLKRKLEEAGARVTVK